MPRMGGRDRERISMGVLWELYRTHYKIYYRLRYSLS